MSSTICSRIPGRCTFTTTARPSRSSARCTCPSEAEASGRWSSDRNAFEMRAPTSRSTTSSTTSKPNGSTSSWRRVSACEVRSAGAGRLGSTAAGRASRRWGRAPRGHTPAPPRRPPGPRRSPAPRPGRGARDEVPVLHEQRREVLVSAPGATPACAAPKPGGQDRLRPATGVADRSRAASFWSRWAQASSATVRRRGTGRASPAVCTGSQASEGAARSEGGADQADRSPGARARASATPTVLRPKPAGSQCDTPAWGHRPDVVVSGIGRWRVGDVEEAQRHC